MLTTEQEQCLKVMSRGTHDLFGMDFLRRVNTAFGVSIGGMKYKADGGPNNPKGLYLDGGAKEAIGIACRDLAELLCRDLGISYENKMGRGFQVQTCVEAIRKHFNSGDAQTQDINQGSAYAEDSRHN